MNELFLRAYIAYMEFYDPTLRFNTNICVKKTYQTKYWAAKVFLEGLQDDSLFYIILLVIAGIVVFLSIVLLVLFITKRKPAEDLVNDSVSDD